MSGDLTARDVVVGELLRRWEVAMQPGVTHSAASDADAVLTALAAAGWELHRAKHDCHAVVRQAQEMNGHFS